RRYRSAEELASDLCRYLDDEPLASARRAERAWRWCMRNPVRAGLFLAAVSFLFIMASRAITLARGQEAFGRMQIRQINMNSAAMVAGTVLSQLRALSDAVERASSDKELVRALENSDTARLQTLCVSLYDFYEDPAHGLKLNGNSPFYLWIVLDKDG